MRRPTSSRWKSWCSGGLALLAVLVAAGEVFAVAQPCYPVHRRMDRGGSELAAGVRVLVRRDTNQTLVTEVKTDSDGMWCMTCPGDETEFDVTVGLCVGGRSPGRTCEFHGQCNGGTCGKTYENQPLCGGTGGGGGGGTGDVSSSVSSSSDGADPIFDGVSGKVIKPSLCRTDSAGKKFCAWGYESPDQSPSNVVGSYLNRTGAPSCAVNGAVNQWTITDTSGASVPRMDLCENGVLYHRWPYTGASVYVDDSLLIGGANNTAAHVLLPECADEGRALTYTRAGNVVGCQTLTATGGAGLTVYAQPFGVLGSQTATAPTPDLCQCFRMPLAMDMADLDRVVIHGATADTAPTGLASLAIWAVLPGLGYTDRKVFDAEFTPTTGAITVTNAIANPPALTAGDYWACYGSDTDAADYRLTSTSTGATAMLVPVTTVSCLDGVPPSNGPGATATIAAHHRPFLALIDD